MRNLPSDDEFEKTIARLTAQDHLLAQCLIAVPPPVMRFTRREGFAGLLQIILAQQVSTASANGIWRKLTERLPEPTPENFLTLDDEALRACGFSRQKIAYGRGLAAELSAGRLDLDAVARMPDEAALTHLIALKGIGRWSAELYLMAGLNHPDIWPVDDLAIIIGMQWLMESPERPSCHALIERAESWRPYRSIAAHLVWHYYEGTVASRRSIKKRT